MKNLLVICSIFLVSCSVSITDNKSVPDWTKDAIMYEVNVRQYTPEGTFTAFAKHLPRIKDLGVDIIWFMPIHPIGEKK